MSDFLPKNNNSSGALFTNYQTDVKNVCLSMNEVDEIFVR